MAAYYNEIHPGKAAWLRELIKRGVIAPGEVDERDIRDVAPNDLVGFAQCHFFAGIGIWSYALRQAGWPDDRPCWTGSCPCQSFSAAGKRLGFADERHLWPSWFWLIKQREPERIFGEQVSSKDALAWLDLVSADLEGANYAVGALDLCAAGVGAPHIRQRLFYCASRMADTDSQGFRQRAAHLRSGRSLEAVPDAFGNGATGGLADAADYCGRGRERRAKEGAGSDEFRGQRSAGGGVIGGLVDPESLRRIGRQDDNDGGRRECSSGQAGEARGLVDPCRERCDGRPASAGSDQGPGAGAPMPISADDGRSARGEFAGAAPTAGFWADAQWLSCRDGKMRPTEPGTFPLAHGAPARVLRLCGYGDGIVAPLARAFIEASEGWE